MSGARGGSSPRKLVVELCPPSAVQLTPPQRALLKSYGLEGHKVLQQIQAGLPDAVYRAALFLGTDPAHACEAKRLLLQAAAAYHPAAIELSDANGGRPGPLDAARHACRLADAAWASGAKEEGLAYYMCAAKAGLPIATIKLAIARLGTHKEHQIADWLATIADQLESDGNPDAE